MPDKWAPYPLFCFFNAPLYLYPKLNKWATAWFIVEGQKR